MHCFFFRVSGSFSQSRHLSHLLRVLRERGEVGGALRERTSCHGEEEEERKRNDPKRTRLPLRDVPTSVRRQAKPHRPPTEGSRKLRQAADN